MNSHRDTLLVYFGLIIIGVANQRCTRKEYKHHDLARSTVTKHDESVFGNGKMTVDPMSDTFTIVPMNVLIRPMPSVLDENKVASLMNTIQVIKY